MSFLDSLAKKGSLRRQFAPAVVVAGLGRCGTTFMMNAIGRSMDALYYPSALSWNHPKAAIFNRIGKKYSVRKEDQFLLYDNIGNHLPAFGFFSQGVVERGYVYKTHGYPFPDIPLSRHIRLIWMFGDPMMIAASMNNAFLSDPAQKRMWHIKHYDHLESPHYENRDEILTRDTCLLERHFDVWYRPHAFPFLSLRYEALKSPQVQQSVADFVGIPLQFPPWKTRSANWQSHPRRAELEATYGRLQAKVEAAEDVKIWPAQKVRPEWQEH